MKVTVSGLINIETNVSVKEFPIQYFPIDYPFFGVDTSVGGVGYNVAKALTVLGDEVSFFSLTGADVCADTIRNQLYADGIDSSNVKNILKATPQSVVLYDKSGKREIYCDLKDIQETSYEADDAMLKETDVFALCNINFNRTLLKKVKAMGKLIATDVHVLSNVNDEYNRDFIENADIIFMSDEGVIGREKEFIKELAASSTASVIVMGRGGNGLTYYDRKNDLVKDLPAFKAPSVVNTVGAGDALFSSFLHFYVNGGELEESLTKAQMFAGLKIGVSGAAKGFVSEDKVNALF